MAGIVDVSKEVIHMLLSILTHVLAAVFGFGVCAMLSLASGADDDTNT
jgi:hypothetical protein